MKPAESVEKLIELAALSGVSINECTPRQGFELFFSFYDRSKSEGCDGPENDMLLFQWGVYGRGEGRFFHLNITRQFSENNLEDDDVISQLSLTFKVEPTDALLAIDSGNCWSDGRFESPTFQDFIFTSNAFLEVSRLDVKKIELAHWYV